MAAKSIPELDELTALSNNDLFIVVHDPSGVNTTNKITANNAFSRLVSNAAAAYSNAVLYVNSKSYANTSQLSSNLANYVLISSESFITPEQYGAIGNGNNNPASTVLGVSTLAELQAYSNGIYSFADSINNTMDYLGIQAAMNAAVSLGKIVSLGPKTYIADKLAWPANLPTLLGCDSDLSIIKRPSNSTTTASILSATNRNNFTIKGVGFNGNYANNTIGSNNLSFIECYDFRVENCKSYGAKLVDGGYGSGIVCHLSPTENLTGKEIRFDTIECYDNQSVGINITRTGAGITVDNCTLSNNGGSGFQFYDQGITPAANTTPNMKLTNNRAERNGGGGITVLGFFILGYANTRVEGHGSDPVHGLIVDGNQCNNNTSYGIFVQATGFTVTDNVCRDNGTTNQAGICANAEDGIISGNIISGGTYFGIDAGGCKNVIVSQNNIRDVISGVGINLGACINVRCVDNIIRNCGYIGIHIARYDAGSYWFPFESQNITVSRNTIIETRSSGNFGILTRGLPDDVFIEDNIFEWPDTTAYNAMLPYYTRGRVKGNRLVGSTTQGILMNSGTVINPPDWADTLLINTDTYAISGIVPRTAVLANGKIMGGIFNSRGNSYTTDFLIDCSAGGGTGEEIWARIARDGTIAAIDIVEGGTGHTSSSFTVSLEGLGGGGTGGSVTFHVGRGVVTAREFRLMAFSSDIRLSSGNANQIVDLPTPDNSEMLLKSGGAITLVGQGGAWHCVGWSHPGGSIYPTQIQFPTGGLVLSGNGSPEGVYSAPVGSLYLRGDGSTSTTLYVKTSGTGDTGWTPK